MVFQLIKNWQKNKFKITKLPITQAGLIILSPWPFFLLLTLMKTKIYWYVIIFLPLITLSLCYFYLTWKNKFIRFGLFAFCLVYFIVNFLPATFTIKVNYTVPEKLKLARCLANKPADKIGFLVDEDERKVRNFLEAAHYDTTSSYFYGGSPSFVYYSQKSIDYYYNIEDWLKHNPEYHLLVVSKKDINNNPQIRKNLEPYRTTDCNTPNWIGLYR
jgi:hypothetical protein